MNEISKKKDFFPVEAPLLKYLTRYERTEKLPVHYDDLLRYVGSIPLYDDNGEDTLWTSMMYAQQDIDELNKGLTMIYALLKAGGEISVMEHLFVDRIDYCTFGNSKPFRIRIKNKLNDNYDYYYIKTADASRIYGLELEDLLSPNRINYMIDKNTLIEEHIAGIPGDVFMEKFVKRGEINKVRLAKEFIKFNERCFMRLLGDMRAYNYVLEVTPDFDGYQYRIRAIDFDQQSYEGKKQIYLPQFFKENYPMVELCMDLLDEKTMRQYQKEERTLVARRLKISRYRIKDLIDTMSIDKVSKTKKVDKLKKELNEHHKTKRFDKCKNMGDVVKLNLKLTISKV